jgi:hypothetical protein
MSLRSWLMDGDPAIRWQVMADLLDDPVELVTAERARVAVEGWGARLLGAQRQDGTWSHGGPAWHATLFALVLLKDLGADPAHPRVRGAVDLVRERVTWGPHFDNSPWFEGEVEPCINGNTLAAGAYFGIVSERLVDRLLREQLADGGWNCEAERGSVRSSFHTTICVLEGLAEVERLQGARTAVARARERAHEYLLERRLWRRLSTGEEIRERKRAAARSARSWTRFAYPPLWRYDLLRALDYFRRVGLPRDARMDEALAWVRRRRHQNKRWPLGSLPPAAPPMDLGETRGEASRWITLRALRVLRTYDPGSSQALA